MERLTLQDTPVASACVRVDTLWRLSACTEVDRSSQPLKGMTNKRQHRVDKTYGPAGRPRRAARISPHPPRSWSTTAANPTSPPAWPPAPRPRAKLSKTTPPHCHTPTRPLPGRAWPPAPAWVPWGWSWPTIALAPGPARTAHTARRVRISSRAAASVETRFQHSSRCLTSNFHRPPRAARGAIARLTRAPRHT